MRAGRPARPQTNACQLFRRLLAQGSRCPASDLAKFFTRPAQPLEATLITPDSSAASNAIHLGISLIDDVTASRERPGHQRDIPLRRPHNLVPFDERLVGVDSIAAAGRAGEIDLHGL